VNFKDRYNFWTDRTLDGYRYRFSEFAIKRHAVGSPEHWEVSEEFDDPHKTARAWRTICDRAAEEAKAHA
jgi:hypothetical protein